MRKLTLLTFSAALLLILSTNTSAPAQSVRQAGGNTAGVTILHAARLLDIEAGKIIAPGEILVQGTRIAEVGTSVTHFAGAEIIDLGDVTLMPGLIDAHVHLFLHPGAEDLQTVQESVPQRTILALLAAHDDLMAGFTAERDMGTEGAGSADSAVRNAIDRGLMPGPRMRISGNAISILGGHEDAINYNPEEHILSNATYANNTAEIITVIRQQFKEGADFIKMYETGRDNFRDGQFTAVYQYTEAELIAAVQEAARNGKARRRSRHWRASARFTPRVPGWNPSTTPISSALKPCASCAINRFRRSPHLRFQNILPIMPEIQRQFARQHVQARSSLWGGGIPETACGGSSDGG